MSKNTGSLDGILEGFNPSPGPKPAPRWTRRRALTVWLEPEWHARYKALQHESKETFSKKIRELVMAAIAITESRNAPKPK